jgi:hypothetical protein
MTRFDLSRTEERSKGEIDRLANCTLPVAYFIFLLLCALLPGCEQAKTIAAMQFAHNFLTAKGHREAQRVFDESFVLLCGLCALRG